MKHFLGIFIFVFFVSCLPSKNNITENTNDFRKYHCNDTMLDKGYVKVYVLEKSDSDEIRYCLQKKTKKNEFISTSYNAKFIRTRDVYYSILKNGFIENKYVVYNENIPIKLEIVSPITYTFKSSELEFKGKYQFPKNRFNTTTIENTHSYAGKSQIIYKGDTVDCIKYLMKEIMTETNKRTSKIRSKSRDYELYYGNGFGLIYQEMITNGDTIKLILKDIIDIKEFENLKAKNKCD